MKITYKVTPSEFLPKLLAYLVPVIGSLSPVETEVISEFLALPQEKFKYNRFSSLGRRKVHLAINQNGHAITTANINNRIYDLVKKGIILRDEDNLLQIIPAISKPYEQFLKSGTFTLSINFETKDN